VPVGLQQIALGCVLTACLAACWGGGAADQPAGPNGTTPPFTRLALAPSSATVRSGDTVRITATPLDAQGSAVAGLPAPTFESSDPITASVDAGGLVTGQAQGTAFIRAVLTANGTTHSDSSAVTVTSAAAGRLIVTTPGISFSPSSATIGVGDTVAWEFSGAVHNVTFSGAAPPGGNIPDQNPGSVVERVFTAAGTFGYACTRHNGMTGQIIVQASSGTPTYSALSLSPALWAMRVGTMKALVPTPLDQNGQPMSGLPAATFTSSDPAVVSVDPVGTLSAATEGPATVTASLSADGMTFTATSSIEVVPATAVTVTVGGGAFTPDRVDIAPGVTVIFEAADGTHNVTFQTAPPGGDIPALGAGNAAARSFPSAGDYDYQCTVHGENGRVRVR